MTFITKTSAGLAALLIALAVSPEISAQQARDRNVPDYRVQRFMELYDTNGDGKVTLDEIVADQGRLFGAIDVNGDKTLSVEEVKRRGRLLQLWRTTTLFDLLDANGDGKLSAAEVSAPTMRWFKRYDTNRDGVMEASELPERGWHRHRDRHGR